MGLVYGGASPRSASSCPTSTKPSPSYLGGSSSGILPLPKSPSANGEEDAGGSPGVCSGVRKAGLRDILEARDLVVVVVT